MRTWENYIYGLIGAALAALGALFFILGAGCLLGSFGAMIVAYKKSNGMRVL